MEFRYDDVKRMAETFAADSPIAAGGVYAAYAAGFMDLAEAMSEYDDVPDELEARVDEAHEAMKSMAVKAIAMAADLGREDSE